MSPTRATLDAWMARLAEGDRSAIEPLYAALWPRCLALAVRLLEDPVQAEDVAQQALVTLFSQAARFEAARGSAVSWALTLVAWECRTLRRRAQRRRESAAPEALLALPSADQDPEDQVIQAALLADAEQALALLSAQDRETLALALGDVSPAERALPPATFRKRRQRALSRLQAAWRSLYDGA